MALGCSHLLRWPTLCGVCFSLNKSTSLPITSKKKKVMALVYVGAKWTLIMVTPRSSNWWFWRSNDYGQKGIFALDIRCLLAPEYMRFLSKYQRTCWALIFYKVKFCKSLIPPTGYEFHLQVNQTSVEGKHQLMSSSSSTSLKSCCSISKLCLTLCEPVDCSTPGSAVLRCLPEFAQICVHWVGDAIQPSHPLSSPSPALNFSQHQGLFQRVSSHIRWPKYRSFSISPFNEYLGFISFRIGWFDLAVPGTLKSSRIQKHQRMVTVKTI